MNQRDHKRRCDGLGLTPGCDAEGHRPCRGQPVDRARAQGQVALNPADIHRLIHRGVHAVEIPREGVTESRPEGQHVHRDLGRANQPGI